MHRSKNVMGGSAETAPLGSNRPKSSLHPSTSYQSAGSGNSSSGKNVEEYYGDDGGVYFGEETTGGTSEYPATFHQYGDQKEVDTSWAVENGNGGNTNTGNYGSTNAQESESSDADSEDDDESSEEETSADEETPIIVKKTKQPSRKKKKKEKKTRWHDENSGSEEGDEEDEEYSDDEYYVFKPRRNCCHSFFITVQMTAVIANLSMIAIEMAPLKFGKFETLDIVLRCYFTLFSLCFLFAGKLHDTHCFGCLLCFAGSSPIPMLALLLRINFGI